jgi:hypothetical protein
MLEMDADAFDALVTDELDLLPDEMIDGLDNVVFVVEDRPETVPSTFWALRRPGTERDRYGVGELPDRIIVYREPHLHACDDEPPARRGAHHARPRDRPLLWDRRRTTARTRVGVMDAVASLSP